MDIITTSQQQEEDFSYPVGKVDELTLYPMDFEEFLWATNNDVLAEEIREHYKTNEGLAESVKKFVETYSFIECRAVQQSILNGYDSDMGKYAKPATTVKIKACWNSIPAQFLNASLSVTDTFR